MRDRLSGVDAELIALVAARQRIVAEIAAHKIERGAPTRDYEREREVLGTVRGHAEALGVDADLAEEIVRLLIRSSLTQQERTRVAAHSGGAGRRVLIIGGAGKMGLWFGDFLASQGFQVEVADPDPSAVPFPRVANWRDVALDHDVIVVATPMRVAAPVLTELAERAPPGLIVDIGSLKGPCRAAFASLVEAGCRITSIHPMFGPDTRLLSGRHVVFVDVGDPKATAEARTLFTHTMAEPLEMTLDEHDRLMAHVLGLSHALNLAFFTALAGSGELAPRLRRMSSTTFDAQLEVATRVAHDNPRLYYEIQALNEYGGAALEALDEAVARIRRLVADRDETAFVELMDAGRRYLEGVGRRRDVGG